MRNCLRGVFLLFLVLKSYGLAAQNTIPVDTLRERYNKETLHLKYGYLARGMNADKIDKHDAKTLFSISPDGWMAYEKYRSKSTLGRILLTTGVASTLAAIFVANKNSKLATGLLFGGVGLEVIGSFQLRQSREMLDRAIWMYNRDVLLQPADRYTNPNKR